MSEYRQLVKRLLWGLGFVLFAGSCVSSKVTPGRDDPLAPRANTAPRPKVGAALAPDFDPLASPSSRGTVLADPAHAHHQHDHGAHADDDEPEGQSGGEQ